MQFNEGDLGSDDEETEDEQHSSNTINEPNSKDFDSMSLQEQVLFPY